jgi:dolichol-phosphate mannosyltransferase
MHDDTRLRRGFWMTLAVVSVWKVVVGSTLTLCYDESYYHYWSLHPQLSYFDHPPMTAWLMTLSGAAFGNSVWTVRIWPLLFSTLAALLARRTASEMFDKPAGDRAGILILLAPIFLGNGVVMTPDVPLALCWVAAIFCAWRAVQAEGLSWTWWSLAGVAAGLGFLSKYNMVLFFGGLILFFILSPQDRKRVFLGCLIAGVVATLFFTPVIAWNVLNGFASFKFQLNRRMVPTAHHSALQNIGEYAGIVIAVVTPVLGLLCFYVSALSVATKNRARLFCAAFFWSVVGGRVRDGALRRRGGIATPAGLVARDDMEYVAGADGSAVRVRAGPRPSSLGSSQGIHAHAPNRSGDRRAQRQRTSRFRLHVHA